MQFLESPLKRQAKILSELIQGTTISQKPEEIKLFTSMYSYHPERFLEGNFSFF